MVTLGVVAVALASGCSSGHPSAQPSVSSTTTAVLTGSASPKDVAVALGRKMLADAVLPSGARAGGRAPSNLLRSPALVPGIGNLVFAHRFWTISQDPRVVYRWLEVHRPRGYKANGTNTGTTGGVPTWGVEDDLAVIPPNTSTAELQYSIAGNGSGGAVVRVDTVVGWTKPRPSNELVPATDKTVTVTVVRAQGPRGKRVVTADPALVTPIVRAFNALRVSPPYGPHSCPPMGPRTVSYQIGFSSSPSAAPGVVAVIGKCGSVGVTVAGRPAPALGDFVNSAFADSVAHVLGLPEPHFG